MSLKTNALVLAGGLGSRLRPITDETPKCLVRIGGTSLLERWVASLAVLRPGRVVVNAHHLAARVRSELARLGGVYDMTLEEFFEPELLGSAGTLSANAELADDADAVVVIYADNLSDVDLQHLVMRHREHVHPVTMVLFHASEPRACGIVTLDAEGTVVSFAEKPAHPQGDLANAGLYCLDASAYREAALRGGHDIAFDLLPHFVGRMTGYVHEGYHLDIGTHATLAQARSDHAAGLLDYLGGAQ